MGMAMERASYSPIFTEGLDYSFAMFDRNAEMVAQHAFDPVHLACMPFTVEWVAKEIGLENLEPDDVVMHNDPYRGGSHLNDVTIMAPVFKDGQLVGMPANRAHQIDIGGMVPGGFAGDATEIFQEGLRIPPVKVSSRGRDVKDVWDLFLANVRDSYTVQGDLRAMIGSLNIGKRRILEYIDKYGLETWNAALEKIKDLGEKEMRAAIDNIPEGRHEYVDYLDDSGTSTERLQIKVAVTIQGSRLIADFDGSSRQSDGPVNAPYAVTAGNTVIGVLHCINVGGSFNPNHGCFRPIKVLAPPGTIVNADFPAAVQGGNVEVSTRVCDAVVGALAQAVDRDRVKAADYGTCYSQTAGGIHPETKRPWTHYQYFSGGGMGGRAGKDGNNVISPFATNNKNQTIEVLETRFPILFEDYSLVRDSPGPGKYRSGVGLRHVWKLTSEKATVSSLGDRTTVSPYGLFGGFPPTPLNCGHFSDTRIRRSGEKEFKHLTEISRAVSPSKWSNFTMRKGDAFETILLGGGGYGNPLERDAELVLSDVRNEYISLESARSVYGVVINPSTMTIDSDATRSLRRFIGD
jgi:N-methylhydantoinase B/oxoprolinase/acetone carboxylase alpha subunit